ncbi:MAG: 2-phosphosulfolactate phosphatase [Candidatus Hydrogenedentes bacterium]|nr:2-phosphosulfolactate phosphatase [Candidatus Hydrogenedentota bacterium]
MQTWHLIEGEPGCAFATAHGCVAVVVDALRASATAAMLFEARATELIVVQEVKDARAAKAQHPDALLFGERGGLPPPGFDYGNSPRDAARAAGRPVVFTTTTGAGRLVACWGAPAVFMGTTVNASAVIEATSSFREDVVLIPAGLATDPTFDAQEDWAAAAAIAAAAGTPIGEGAAAFAHWRRRIQSEGLDRLFNTAPHAGKLRAVGLDEDIAFCAQMDLTRAVPRAVARNEFGVRCLPFAPPLA